MSFALIRVPITAAVAVARRFGPQKTSEVVMYAAQSSSTKNFLLGAATALGLDAVINFIHDLPDTIDPIGAIKRLLSSGDPTLVDMGKALQEGDTLSDLDAAELLTMMEVAEKAINEVSNTLGVPRRSAKRLSDAILTLNIVPDRIIQHLLSPYRR